MKKIKNYAMALAALAIAATSVTLMSFQKEKTINSDAIKAQLVDQEWHFDGALNPTNNNPKDSTQYSLFATELCDENPETICKINAPAMTSNPNLPDLNYVVPENDGKTVKDLIDEALDSGEINDVVRAFRSE